uniref:Uncharacterized protein n=1 Tax=Chenopodium quinoa TaxID=63459 RepID=A0A803LK24_CHEQI
MSLPAPLSATWRAASRNVAYPSGTWRVAWCRVGTCYLQGEILADVPTKPLIVNLESQFNQAGQQLPSRSRGRETIPAEHRITRGAQVGIQVLIGMSWQQNAQPRQTEYRKQGDPSMQNDAYRQNHTETSRQGGNPTGRKITIDVISGGPVYGGSVSGAKKSLSEYRHIVNALSVEERPRPSPMFSISFSEEDAKGIVFPHDDPLVLILTVNGADIKRALVDGGSSANILFARAFDAMRIGRKYLTPVSYPVIGFNGSTVRPEGSIVLQVRWERGRQ